MSAQGLFNRQSSGPIDRTPGIPGSDKNTLSNVHTINLKQYYESSNSLGAGNLSLHRYTAARAGRYGGAFGVQKFWAGLLKENKSKV